MPYIELLNIKDLIGKKIVAIKGYKGRKNKKDIDPEYILFDDGETYIELAKQDYHDHHDCDLSARRIIIYKSKKSWNVLNDDKSFGDAYRDFYGN